MLTCSGRQGGMTNMIKKVLLIVVLVIIGIFVLSEFLVPEHAASEIRTALDDYFDEYSDLELKVGARPALKLLDGKADYLEFSARRVRAEGLYFDAVYAYFTDLEFQDDEIIGEMKALELVLLAADLNDYLVDYDIELLLEPGSVRALTPVEVFGQIMEIKVRGSLSIREERYLVFSPDSVILEGLEIPRAWLDDVLKEVRLEIDLDRFPVPFRVEEVHVGEDKLLLKAEDNNNN